MARFISLTLLAAGLITATVRGDDLADKAKGILTKHCFSCHGEKPDDLAADLNLFDAKSFLDAELKAVVPGKPADSRVMVRMADAAKPMPPVKVKNPVSPEDQKIVAEWIAAYKGGDVPPPVPAPAVQPAPAVKPATATGQATANNPNIAADAKRVFRDRCGSCHSGTEQKMGINVLDRSNLLTKKKIVPGDSKSSRIIKLMNGTSQTPMPPNGSAPASPEEVEIIRRWIDGGAPDFPADIAPTAAPKPREDVGTDYVMNAILNHVRSLPSDELRRYTRYFSMNHIVASGATELELQHQREGFIKVINHMSMAPRLAKPRAIDKAGTVFAVDIRELYWHHEPYYYYNRHSGEKPLGKASFTLYDLALIEYPYAVNYTDQPLFDKIMAEYVLPAKMMRPIPYIRTDWFASVMALPPFYEDMLRLPHKLQDLEKKLGVDSYDNIVKGVAYRAGMTVSGVSRNNRVVERHPISNGFYWKSFDFKSNRARENMFKDPIDFDFTGGEMIFTLPNGLQGYYVCDKTGARIEEAPTSIVTDKHASDKTVRNGLNCMRCHVNGMKDFKDDVRPALDLVRGGSLTYDIRNARQLYPPQNVLDGLIADDGERFTRTMTDLLGKPHNTEDEPLVHVSKRYIDDAMSLRTVAAELGYPEEEIRAYCTTPGFANLGLAPLGARGSTPGKIRRDAWEDSYEAAVRAIGLGTPIVNIDGISRRDYPVGPNPFDYDLKLNKKGGVYGPGEDLVLSFVNKCNKPVYIEICGADSTGNMVIFEGAETIVQPGATHTFKRNVGKSLSKDKIIVLASDVAFPKAYLLHGEYMGDRVVRPLYEYRRNQNGTYILTSCDPARMVKRTIDIETR